MNKMHLSKIRINESLDGTSFFDDHENALDRKMIKRKMPMI